MTTTEWVHFHYIGHFDTYFLKFFVIENICVNVNVVFAVHFCDTACTFLISLVMHYRVVIFEVLEIRIISGLNTQH
jgi:hypothetical protein